ncbi:signal peptidase I, partial [Jatrophihabitans endophyticus]|uniref:signal peptidase I n=1 Tax=Jatrophihabitans endophyticus TaxID=1206085 RepID=UPI0019DEF3D1
MTDDSTAGSSEPPESGEASGSVKSDDAATDSAPARTGLFRRRRERTEPERAEKPRRKAPWWELPALVVLAIGIAIVVKSFVIQPFYIPSDSMEKTLHGCTGCSGDRILVNKTIYDFRDPHPGDIIVFHDPKDWASEEPESRPPSNPVVRAVRGFGQLIGFVPPDGEILVKRVIATGGETVKGNAAGVVSISDNGPKGPYRKLDEPFVYAPHSEYIDGRQEQPFGPVTVPKGRLWVMGDHRTDSADSRYHCTPGGQGFSNELHCNPESSTVPVGDVIGKAFVIAWPPSRWRTLGTPSTFEQGASASGSA